MKKIIFFIIFYLLISFNLNAQSEKISKPALKKVLKIEIIDIQGDKHKGYLWYADSSKLLLSKDELYGKDINEFYPNEIYQIKTIKYEPFLEYAITGFLTGTLITTLGVVALIDESFLGIGFIMTVNSVIFGLPSGLINGLLTKNFFKNKTESIINSNPDRYKNYLPLFNQNNYSIDTIKKPTHLNLKKDNEELKYVPKPCFFFHPKYFSRFHLSVSSNLILTNLLFSTKNEYKKLGLSFTDKKYYPFPLSLKFGFNFNENFRPYISFFTSRKHDSFGSVSFKYNDSLHSSDYAITNVSVKSFAVGCEYVFNPLDNRMLHRNVFSVGFGFTNYYINHNSYIYSLVKVDSLKFGQNNQIQNFKTQGLKISGKYEYYLNRYISFNIGIFSDIVLPVKVKSNTALSPSGRSLTIESYNLNLSSIYFKFGIQFHL